jgi:hypothetical protein
MRRLVCLVAIALIALCYAGTAAAGGQRIYIRNMSTSVPDADVVDALPAFQAAVSEDFAPFWHVDAELVFLGHDPAPLDGWRIVLVDSPACWFCDGFHEVAKGIPRAEVGMQEGWQVTFSHELFEMLADPMINRGVLVGKKWYALEVCDPVEANEIAYERPSATGVPVQISDFVTENWFRPHSAGPYDFLRQTHRPLQVMNGGYSLVWRNNDWADTGVSSTRHARAE